MSSLYVTDVTVPVLLDRLRRREWQVPQFQREIVWSVADVIELTKSIIESRLIGMATLWEQGPSPEVPVEPVWISDAAGRRYVDGDLVNRNKVFAILDGRQRCTAIAMAFGGAESTRRKVQILWQILPGCCHARSDGESNVLKRARGAEARPQQRLYLHRSRSFSVVQHVRVCKDDKGPLVETPFEAASGAELQGSFASLRMTELGARIGLPP